MNNLSHSVNDVLSEMVLNISDHLDFISLEPQTGIFNLFEAAVVVQKSILEKEEFHVSL